MLEASDEARVSLRTPILFVLAPFALLYALCNYYRSVNAVLAPHLIAAFQLNAAQLGLLVSVYFLCSALFQVPLGLILDRFGPRRVQATLIILAAGGACIFALGSYWPLLLFGRAIMGIGSAGGLMTSILAVTMWFPSSRWPVMTGLVMSLASIGALFSTLPTQLVLNVTDWRHVLLGVALLSIAAVGLLLAVVPEKKREAKGESFGEQLRGLGLIYRDPLFWRFAPLYLTTTGSTMAFQSLWAGPWLHDVAGFGANAVATHLLVISALQICSYFVIGWLATTLAKFNIKLPHIVMTGSAIYIASVTPLLLPNGAGVWSVILGAGLLSNVNTLCYSIMSRHFPKHMTGRANAALNFFYFIGAFIVQFAVGLVMDTVPATVPGHYPVTGYRLAFAVMIALQIVAWTWCILRREKVAEAAAD